MVPLAEGRQQLDHVLRYDVHGGCRGLVGAQLQNAHGEDRKHSIRAILAYLCPQSQVNQKVISEQAQVVDAVMNKIGKYGLAAAK